jgi:uncharacterized protein involved in exopolysaccharide biosynthesis
VEMRTVETETKSLAPLGVQGLSMRDIVFTLFRRRWIIVVVALPIIIMGGLSLFRQTGAYTAASRVVVELIKVDNPQWNVSGRNIDFDRELSTLFNIAMSVPVAEKAALALQDSIPVIQELDHRLVDLDKGRNLVEYLLENQDASVVGESNILEFSFTAIHPRISLMAVGAQRDAFISYQIYGRKNINAIVYYEEQIGLVRSSIDSLLQVRSSVMVESGYTSLKDDLRNHVGQLSELENELFKAEKNYHTLNVQYQNLKKYLDRDPREFPMGVDESRSHTLVYWRNMVGKHDDEMNRILSVHTKSSLPVERQQRVLVSSLERLHGEEVAYVESIKIAMDTIKGSEEALRRQIAIINVRNSGAPYAYQRISLLDVEINSLRGLMEDLQGKWGEVRISEMADERVSNVNILTEPELVMVLSGGKTVVYFVMIIFFALALGIVAALVLEAMDHRVYVARDVEEHLKLPVFASVTKAD